MTNQVVTTLPGGLWANGAHWREAELRELTGEDQIFLMEERQGLLPAQWATEALARAVTRLGPDRPTRDAIRLLTVGDREALLLHLRRLTAGDRLPCVLTCPSPECREKLELELSTANLLVLPYDDVRQQYEHCIPRADGVSTTIRFRLPTGSDQEAVAALARTDPDRAAELLLQRCVQSAVSSDGATMEPLPESVRSDLSAYIARLDGQAEITLQVTCVACGGAFSVIFDTASYLIQELEVGMRQLLREVHLLAYHYHWSPTEILGMSTRRRRQFLRLLEEELMQGTAQ
jgi:hypothetical protein